jgi:vancomycin resistance protein YoaR
MVVYHQQQADRIYPGVSVFGVTLGRLSQEQAAAAIKSRLIDQSKQPFLLRYDDEAATVSLAALGLVIDDEEIARIAAQAWAVGRDEELTPWLRTQLDLLEHGYAVPVQLSLDRERAAAVLGRLAPEVEHPTENASLAVEKAGERFEIHTTPARTGRRLNIDETLDHLEAALAKGLPTQADLVLDEAPPGIADADLAPAIEAIQTMLASPLEFKDGTRTWRLEVAALFDMLEITGLDTGHPPVSARLNETKLRDFVEKTARAADVPAQNPTFAVEGDQVVIKKGTAGKLADAGATFEAAKQQAASQAHSVDIVFKEDQPWLSEADLEPVRAQANALLALPIAVETAKLPGITEKSWVLDRAQLAQMLVLPETRTVSRDYATLPPAARPKFDIQLDSGKVTNFLAREVAPWVSEDPVDAALELRETEVDVPNPAYLAGVAEEQRRAAGPAGTPVAGGPDLARTPGTITAPQTIKEKRYSVELRGSKEGRGPDYLGTFSGMQLLFRSGVPTNPDERRVTVRLAPRPPKVQDRDLTAARDMANLLIGEPVTLRWGSASWVVTRDELVSMLRYQNGASGLSAYLTRDGLIAKATAIAGEARQRPDAPKDYEGNALPVDVDNTAGTIWLLASTRGSSRSGDVVWNDDAIKRADAEAAAATVNEAFQAQATATAQAQGQTQGSDASTVH